MKKNAKYIFIVFFILLSIGLLINNRNMNVIVHAGGGIKNEDTTYLNSLEGFIENYESGNRIFEFDFMLSSDFEVVSTHAFEEELYGENWSLSNRFSLSEFELIKVDEIYTTLSFYDILNLMVEYNDVFIVIDTKEIEDSLYLLYEIIHNNILEIDLDLSKRIIPQLYNEEMYFELENIYNYDEYILTLYATDLTNAEVIELINKYSKIKVLTISHNRDNGIELIWEIKKQNIDIDVYIHTINNKVKVFLYKLMNIDGIYSDFLYNK